MAPNKFLAKIASDWHKPNGICVIKPSQVQSFIQDLPLKKIPGVGKVTQEKLKSLNLETLGDLQQIEEAILIQHFGKYGRRLFFMLKVLMIGQLKLNGNASRFPRKRLSMIIYIYRNANLTGSH